MYESTSQQYKIKTKLVYNILQNVQRGKGFPGGSAGENSPAIQEPQEMWVQFQGQEDLLEEDMATHSSILAWRIPWTGYSPQGCEELDRTESTQHTYTKRKVLDSVVFSGQLSQFEKGLKIILS